MKFRVVMLDKSEQVKNDFKHQINIGEIKKDVVSRRQGAFVEFSILVEQILSVVNNTLSEAKKALEKNKIQRSLVDFVLWIFDNPIFSWLPFVTPLKKFSEEQKALAECADKSAKKILFEKGVFVSMQDGATALIKIDNEPTPLKEAKKKFGGKVTEQYYQDQLAKYRTNRTLLFLEIFNHSEISFEIKKQYLSDLIRENPDPQRNIAGYSIDTLNQEGKTPLHLAIEKVSLEMVKFLVEEHNANVNLLCNGESPLFLAFKAGQPEIVNYLREKGATSRENLHPLLITKVREGNIATVRFLLAEDVSHLKADPNDTLFGNTPLYESAVFATRNKGKESGIALVRLLLEQEHIRKNFINNVGNQERPLQLAIEDRNLALVKLFLEFGKNLASYTFEQKNVLLHLAIKAGDAALVTRLLDEGAYIGTTFNEEEKDTHGNNPLHLTIESGNEEVIRILLERTKWWTKIIPLAIFNEVNNRGENTLHIAVRTGKKSIVEALLAAGVNPYAVNEFKNSLLQVAVVHGHLSIVEHLLLTRINAHVANKEGNTVLHAMAARGDVKLIQALINREKASLFASKLLARLINAQNVKGETALHLAMESLDLVLIQLLIEDGANVNAKNILRKTPFETEKGELVFERIRDKRGKGGNRIFETLYRKLHREGVEEKHDQNQLKKEKAPEAQLPSSHLSADLFMYYRTSSNKWMVKGIIKSSSSLLAMRDSTNDTILHAIVAKNDLKMLEFTKQNIAEHGQGWPALLNAVNDDGETALHVAVRNSHVDMVKCLLEEGIDKAVENAQEQTAWSIALETEYSTLMGLLHTPEVLAALVPTLDFMKEESRKLWMDVLRNTPQEQKISLLNAQDKNGNTLLHAAVQWRVREDRKYLEENGANVSIENAAGISPLILAELRCGSFFGVVNKIVNEAENGIFSLVKENYVAKVSYDEQTYHDLNSQNRVDYRQLVLFKRMGFNLRELLSNYIKLIHDAGNGESSEQKIFLSRITGILDIGNEWVKSHEIGKDVLNRQAMQQLIEERHTAIKHMKKRIAEISSPKEPEKSKDEDNSLPTRNDTLDFKALRKAARAKSKEQTEDHNKLSTETTKQTEHIVKSNPALEEYNNLCEVASRTNNLNVTTPDGKALLHLAISTGDLALVKNHFNQIALLNHAKPSPLDIAVQTGNLEIAKILVSNGATVNESQALKLMNLTNEAGETFLAQLTTREKMRQRKLLTAELSEVDKQESERDRQFIQLFVPHFPGYYIEINHKMIAWYGLDEHMWSNPAGNQKTGGLAATLAKVAKKGQQFVQKATTNPVNVIKVYEHEKDIFDFGNQPEQEKSERGVDAVKAISNWIIYNSAVEHPLQITDTQGNTLLHLATQDGMDVVVSWLLPKTATEKVESIFDKVIGVVGSAVEMAASKLTEEALKKVADKLLNETTSEMVGATVTAVTAPVLSVFSVPAGALASKLNGNTIENGAEKAAEWVMGIVEEEQSNELPAPSESIHPNCANGVRDTPLHIAARYSEKLWMVLAFIQAGANIDQKNHLDDTPLHAAVRAGNLAAAKVFLRIKNQKIINMQNAAGETPLHLAVQKGNVELVKLLSGYGAHWQIQTKLHQTPADLVDAKLRLLDEVSSSVATEQTKAYLSIQKIIPKRAAAADTNTEKSKYYSSVFSRQNCPSPVISHQQRVVSVVVNS